MLEVTPIALEKLTNYLQEHKVDMPIRIAIMGGGCSGAVLGMSLDKADDKDKSFKKETLEFLIEEELLSMCGEVKVDFIESENRSGFAVTSANPVSVEGGCNGSCASGSCG